MRTLTLACALLLGLPFTAEAQADEATPGRELAELIYGSIEESQTGSADLGEFVNFGRDIFVSMDADENGSIDPGEFTEWDFGFNYIAEDEGQNRAFQTAQKIIFAIWDHDGDGTIGRQEYQKSMAWDFRRADTDNDAFLTREEFLRGYIINLAYRAAIIGQ